MLTFSNINDLFNFQCPAFCRRLLKRLYLKAPTDARRNIDSKEPPYVTSKEPPMLLRCALWNWPLVFFKIGINRCYYFSYFMGGGNVTQVSKSVYKTGGGMKYDYVIF